MIADCIDIESSIYIYRTLCFRQNLPQSDAALNVHCFPDMRVAQHLLHAFVTGAFNVGISIILIALRFFSALIRW